MSRLLDFFMFYAAELTLSAMFLVAFAGLYWLCWRNIHCEHRERRQENNQTL